MPLFLLICFTLAPGQQLSRAKVNEIAIISNSIIDDFCVTDGKEGNQGILTICLDSNGNFVVTWQDERNHWNGDIYAQRYLSDCTTIGTNFIVNDDPNSASQRCPVIASDPDGNFVISWREHRDDIFEIIVVEIWPYLSHLVTSNLNWLCSNLFTVSSS